MSFETVIRSTTLIFTLFNFLVLLHRWRKYGATWNTKTLDGVWVLGMWNFVACSATVDAITGGDYAEIRVVLVVIAALLTTVMLFRQYDDATVQTRPKHPRRRSRRS